MYLVKKVLFHAGGAKVLGRDDIGMLQSGKASERIPGLKADIE